MWTLLTLLPSISGQYYQGGSGQGQYPSNYNYGQNGQGVSKTLGVEREYWIVAEEIVWDYAPSATLGYNNPLTGKPYRQEERLFVDDLLGSRYVKAVYRAYSPYWMQRQFHPEHLGFLGPVIRAEVGDSITIHLMNRLQIPCSFHPHGVFYYKDSEGAEYNDGTPNQNVMPGGNYTYRFQVPPRAGPDVNDPSSIAWMYHSHFDEPGDTNAGLVGYMIITRQGMARSKSDPSPYDVSREYGVLFTIMNENISPYLNHNLIKYYNEFGVWPTRHPDFVESNLLHAINGYVFADLPGLHVKKGETVRWFLFGLGNEVDIHTAHWHGSTVSVDGHRFDVADLLPATHFVGDMVPDSVGTWLFHCHVNDHILAGMSAFYRCFDQYETVPSVRDGNRNAPLLSDVPEFKITSSQLDLVDNFQGDNTRKRDSSFQATRFQDWNTQNNDTQNDDTQNDDSMTSSRSSSSSSSSSSRSSSSSSNGGFNSNGNSFSTSSNGGFNSNGNSLSSSSNGGFSTNGNSVSSNSNTNSFSGGSSSNGNSAPTNYNSYVAPTQTYTSNSAYNNNVAQPTQTYNSNSAYNNNVAQPTQTYNSNSASNFGISSYQSGPQPSYCSGQNVFGTCVQMARDGEPCDSFCTQKGSSYNEQTNTFIGASGAESNCMKVAQMYNYSYGGSSTTSNGLGCFFIPAYSHVRWGNTGTLSSDKAAWARRFCVCN